MSLPSLLASALGRGRIVVRKRWSPQTAIPPWPTSGSVAVQAIFSFRETLHSTGAFFLLVQSPDGPEACGQFPSGGFAPINNSVVRQSRATPPKRGQPLSQKFIISSCQSIGYYAGTQKRPSDCC